MSLLSWFSRKSPPATSPEVGVSEPTKDHRPGLEQERANGSARYSTAVGPANRKLERLERRELLYGVVRQAMTRAGVLSASYKFKVLSLDPRGRQYLIMMDLASHMAGESSRLTEVEKLIAQAARSRHDITVTAVYWRVNEQADLGLSRRKTAVPEASGVRRAVAPAAAVATLAPAYDPMHMDEARLFHHVVPGDGGAAPLARSGEVLPAADPDTVIAGFEDTERIPREERHSPLSGTQYGDLS